VGGPFVQLDSAVLNGDPLAAPQQRGNAEAGPAAPSVT
jgi:hypothetical protein